VNEKLSAFHIICGATKMLLKFCRPSFSFHLECKPFRQSHSTLQKDFLNIPEVDNPVAL
jgi:hypothetical protein